MCPQPAAPLSPNPTRHTPRTRRRNQVCVTLSHRTPVTVSISPTVSVVPGPVLSAVPPPSSLQPPPLTAADHDWEDSSDTPDLPFLSSLQPVGQSSNSSSLLLSFLSSFQPLSLSPSFQVLFRRPIAAFLAHLDKRPAVPPNHLV